MTKRSRPLRWPIKALRRLRKPRFKACCRSGGDRDISVIGLSYLTDAFSSDEFPQLNTLSRSAANNSNACSEKTRSDGICPLIWDDLKLGSSELLVRQKAKSWPWSILIAITRTLQRVVKPHRGNCPIVGQILETSNNPYYRSILPFKFNTKCICHCGEKACILRYLLICILLVEAYRS
jgi:hypothetical protein